jgi:5'-3' exonuclease
MESHGASRAILAFDSSNSIRKEFYPTYKSKRKEGLTEEQIAENKEFYIQVRRIQEVLLPASGYRNIIECDGYEADDVIAAVASALPDGVDAVIVSADNDLLQCVGPHVVLHNPSSKKTVDLQSFISTWGLHPEQWAQVKALAGCGTDDVVGISGVGEKTAAAFLTGKLKAGKKFDAINANLGVMAVNLPLVKLPYPGIGIPNLVDDEITEAKKLGVQQELGIRGIRRQGGRATPKPKLPSEYGWDL